MANNNDYKKLCFICKIYEQILKQVIGKDAFLHLSKQITMELIRQDINEMPEGDFKEFNQWMLEGMEKQTDEEWFREWGGTF